MDETQDMTVDEAGKELTAMAVLTAQYSKNWENFEQICISMLRQAYKAGYDAGKKNVPSL